MNKWIFQTSTTKAEFTSFPYAFRAMWTERTKKNNTDMSILSPFKDIYGQYRRYNYEEAKLMAENQGLLTSDGHLNSREFKR